MAPIPVVSEFITGVKPVKSYTFDSDTNGVSFPSASVHQMSDRTLRIDGLQTWDSNVRWDTPIQPGQAVVLDFQSGDTSVVFLDVGNFGDPAYRRVGFNVKSGKLLDDTFRGSTFDMSPLSGTLGTIKPDTWYKAMFAVSPDGTVRMVIWDKNDPTKRVVHEVANPEIAGKSMYLTAGAYSGALIIDQADVLKFDSLIKLPETPVVVQPTPGGGQEPPIVSPVATATEQPPAGGYNFQKEGSQYICRSCPWDESLINSPNILQINLSAWELATNTRTYFYSTITPEQFLAFVNQFTSEGYRPVGMGIWQAENIGDPAVVGLKPHAVWYSMGR